MAGFTTAAIVGLAVGGAAIASKALAPKPPKNEPIPLPEAPKPEDAQAKAADIARRKKSAATQTIFNSPLGAAGEADIAKKTLLGQ